MSGLVGLCITIVLAFWLTSAWPWFLVVTVLLWFPVYVTWDFIFARIVPSKFEAYVPKDQTGAKLF
jgi:hypothetical protein